MRRFMLIALWVAILILAAIQFTAILARPATRPQVGFSFPWRQGGDPDNWSADGTTNYPVTGSVVQAGAGNIPRGAVYVTVLFPAQYDQPPLVYMAEVGFERVYVTDVSVVGFQASIVPESPLASDTVFNWMAVGQ